MLSEIIKGLNALAGNHRIGFLQVIRKDIKGFRRVATNKVFSPQATFTEFAFHHGGRTELQFNVGLETIDNTTWLRHGVAFSLERSRTLPDVRVLVPKIERFNEFLHVEPEEYADFRMWHYCGGVRSSNYSPGPIPYELTERKEKVFICLGQLQRLAGADLELILSDFDRLLPLYEFVEGSALFPNLPSRPTNEFFQPGHTPGREWATATFAPTQARFHLRHNVLESALYDHLSDRFEKESIGTERRNNARRRVDLVLKRGEEFWYYETVVSRSAM
ncbi:MAG TPA: hypothetical protein VFQ48_10940 [Pseudonocardiaceae bacterium]|nr:hypothetical protein [Pseudonocardiaceae bacterium]